MLALGGAPFAPMAGRTMRGYAVLPEALLTDAPALQTWVRKAFEHAALLPPKEKKPAKPRTAAKRSA